MPVGQQFVAIEGKAGSSPIGLVQVHALIARHDELGVLGGVCQGGAEQGAPMRIELYLGVLLDRQGVALRARRDETEADGRLERKPVDRVCLLLLGYEWTYMDFLQSGDKQMRDLRHLSESEACDWARTLVQR